MPPLPSPSKLPAKHEPTPPSSPARAVSSTPSSPAPTATATPAKGLTRMPSITQALDDKSEPVSAKVDAKDVKNTDTEQEVTAEPVPKSTQVVPEESKKQALGTLTENTESRKTPPEQIVREDAPPLHHVSEETADVKGADVEQAETVEQIEAPAEVQKAEKSEPEQCQVQEPEYANRVETEPESIQETPILNNVSQTLLVSDMEAILEKDIDIQSTETSELATQIEMAELNACSPISKEPHSQTTEKQSEDLTLPSNLDAVDNMSVKESSNETATTDPDQSSIVNVPERKPEVSVQIEAKRIESSDDKLSHNITDQEESTEPENIVDQLKSVENGVRVEGILENKLPAEEFTDNTELTPKNNLNVCDTEELIVQMREMKDPFEKSEVTRKDSSLVENYISVDKNDEISEKSLTGDKIDVEDTSQTQLNVPSPSPVTDLNFTEKILANEFVNVSKYNPKEQCTKELCEEKEDKPLEKEQMSTDKTKLEKCMPDQAGGDLEILENTEQKVTIKTVSDNKNFEFGPESTFFEQGICPDKNREEKKMGDTCPPALQEADPKSEKKTSERDKVYEEKPDAVITENEKEYIVIRDELSSVNNKNVSEMVEQLLPEEKAIRQIPYTVTKTALEQSAMPSGLTDQQIKVPSSPVVSKSEDAEAVIEIKHEEVQPTQQAQTLSVTEMVERLLPEQNDIGQIPDAVIEKAPEQSAIPKGLTDHKIEVLSSPVFSKKEDIKAVIEIKPEKMQYTQQAKSPAVTSTISSEKDKLLSEELMEKALVVTDQEITQKTKFEYTAECVPHSLDHDVELASPSSTFSQQERNKSEEGKLTSEAQEKQDDVLQPLIKPNKIDESGEVTVDVAVEVFIVHTVGSLSR